MGMIAGLPADLSAMVSIKVQAANSGSSWMFLRSPPASLRFICYNTVMPKNEKKEKKKDFLN